MATVTVHSSEKLVKELDSALSYLASAKDEIRGGYNLKDELVANGEHDLEKTIQKCRDIKLEADKLKEKLKELIPLAHAASKKAE